MSALAYDEATSLPEILDRVERGEEVTITRGGEPVAKVSPLRPTPKRDEAVIREALRRMDERAEHLSLGGLKIRDLINEGRK